MALDSLEKRRNVPGVGRPWMRVQHPVATPDEQWRIAVGLAYGGNALSPPSAGVGRLLLINPPGLDGGFGTGLSL